MNTTTLASAGGPHISLASLFAQAQPSAQATACARLLRRRVVLPIAAVSGLLALWCAWAPLSGAVVAAGQVQTELGRKVVQHQEGGIVREVLVRQGQAVRRGEPLLVVSDLRSDATLDILRKQQGAEELRSARARAELNMAPSFAWPVGGAVSGELLTRERQLFETRRQTLVEQIAAMESQMRQAHARATALAAQLEASDRSTQLVRDELAMNVKLAEGGFVQKTRLLMLERGVADMQARAEATRGQIAEARMQISSLTNAIAQARGAYQQRAADELKDAGARLREIEDRLRPSQDQVDRQTVRAPVDGTVMAL
ncbi:MAG: hypothetical protein OEM00_09610, partial [Burkholderiaceae bacterium]|nr:hypothetical protein [Burkholderiaceae bacterium]